MTAQEILAELKPLGAEGYKAILLRHGAHEPCYGVKIEYLKKIQKRTKMDHTLALALYDTGVYDAMYLAGLIVDDAQMTKKDFARWAATASEPLTRTVAAVAAGHPQAWPLALEWIDSKKERLAAIGWTTLSLWVSITPDTALDLRALQALLGRVVKEIHSAPNEVRNHMNLFVISIGCYVGPLTALAKKTGQTIGKVTVDIGDTSCEVPYSPDYIAKVEKRGAIGKKRATAKC
ncbi:MAG TPA: DNA alkylation repair protein [Candidatus Didemnitutus sp.]|nr:DNA alkylation repair protein [Candidatus Didemnitutus sp.]